MLCTPFSVIINNSLKCGVFPGDAKTASFTLIDKVSQVKMVETLKALSIPVWNTLFGIYSKGLKKNLIQRKQLGGTFRTLFILYHKTLLKNPTQRNTKSFEKPNKKKEKSIEGAFGSVRTSEKTHCFQSPSVGETRIN